VRLRLGDQVLYQRGTVGDFAAGVELEVERAGLLLAEGRRGHDGDSRQQRCDRDALKHGTIP
jgi:hypothetical protein